MELELMHDYLSTGPTEDYTKSSYQGLFFKDDLVFQQCPKEADVSLLCETSFIEK